ncbi:hypothetical protein Tco_1440769 [Tanacetum coccineum]
MVVEVVVAVWQVVKMMMYGVDDDSVVMWMMVEGGVARLEWPEISSENMGGAGKMLREKGGCINVARSLNSETSKEKV